MAAPVASSDPESDDTHGEDFNHLTEQPIPATVHDEVFDNEHLPVPVYSSSSVNTTWSLAHPFDNDDDGFGPEHNHEQHVDEYEPTVVTVQPDDLDDDVHVKDRQVVSNADTSSWNMLVRECNWKLPVRVPLLPWERGAASSIFTSHDRTPFLHKYRDVTSVSITPSVATHSLGNSVITNPCVDTHRTPVAAWHVVAKRIQQLQSNSSLDSKREYALTKWKTLLQQGPQHCAVGRALLSDVMSLKDDIQLTRTIEDVFCHKSTATLLKRSNSLSKLVLWLNSAGKQVYPIEESSVYQYMYLKASTSPSFAMNLKEALNFAHGTLGVDGAKEAACSARVAGFCRKRVLDRRPVKQAQVLTVRQVIQLENAMSLPIDELDKCFIGHCLFCLYARARWSDALYFKSICIDDNEHGAGYVQCDALISKTSSTLAKKKRFLPLTAVKNGLVSNGWVDDWLLSRSNCNLPEPDGKSPTIRAVLKSGAFSLSHLTSSDASKWLRDVLSATGSANSELNGISTHSLKATTLSWCSKAGVSEERRRLLGYRTQPGSIALLHYSRDALSGPLRALEHVLSLIRERKFFPDASRSGYFVDQPTAINPLPRPPVQVKIGDRVEIDSDDQEDGADISSGADSRENSEDELLARTVPVNQEVTKLRRAKHAGDLLYMHKRWKTMHKSHDEADHKLACGRQIGVVFQRLHEYPSFDYSRCALCFGS